MVVFGEEVDEFLPEGEEVYMCCRTRQCRRLLAQFSDEMLLFHDATYGWLVRRVT